MWRIAFVLTLPLSLSLCDALAAEHSAQEAPDDSKSLVGQLGHELFSVREGATNKLIERGIDARPQLVAALTSTDAEVRLRAKRILSIVADADYQKRKRAFIADVDGQAGTTLPGWAVFKEAIGSDQAARDFFVEISDTETSLLAALEQGPKEAAAVLKECTQAAIEKVQPQGRRNSQPGAMDLKVMAALLFVGGDPSVPLTDEVAAKISGIPGNRTFSDIMSGGARREMFRKLVGRWVARDMSATLVAQNLGLARKYHLREALEPAAKTLESAEATSPANKEARKMALLVIGCLGGKEQLGEVQRYLNDSSVLFDSGGDNHPVQAQMRDLALAVMIKLSEQDGKRFGFENLQFDERFNLNSVAFGDDVERQAAFKKWDEARKTQRQASRGKGAGKSDG